MPTSRQYLRSLAVLAALVFIAACTPPVMTTPAATDSDEAAFWAALPRIRGSEELDLQPGFDLGLAIDMFEWDVLDFYSVWLEEEGWSLQAPTEAMILPPHDRWRKGDLELLIERRPQDEQGRTVLWFGIPGPY